MQVTITKCDGCSKEISKTSEVYHMDLTTNRFWDGTEIDDKVISLDFCRDCAYDIRNILEKISNEK